MKSSSKKIISQSGLSDGECRFQLQRNTILIPEMNRVGARLFAAALRSFDLNARVLPTGEGMEAMGAPHPIFTTPIPENERASRAELIDTANYYFTGLENNDGKGYYPFTDDCVRFENGVDVLARGGTRTTCRKQFEEGLKGIVDRVRDRRFVAVDRERGIAFAFTFFDHYRINWTWQIAELFRMENGQIRRIEAIFHRAPFGMPSGWSTWEQAMSSDVQDVR